MGRRACCKRETKETQIEITLDIDGTGKYNVHTGIGFFDHMLEGFSRHGLFDLDIQVHGDIEVDAHHTVEDTGIVLGQAFKEALGNKEGIARFGYFILPMDDALVLASLDISGRILTLKRNFRQNALGRWKQRQYGNFLWDLLPDWE